MRFDMPTKRRDVKLDHQVDELVLGQDFKGFYMFPNYRNL